ncbi:Fic/DOC family N-terminal domain-containing protein [Rhizobium rhizogenes]|uniref:Fic/DOC family N-terminal domain-containing protein n=1 Tax=Rhizobium rhizogenes TaxID=359 RepID=UPI001F171E12|nr:Fic/DOC family N-terminal domain-containing protein [Rhizobium rhizogenes]
MLNPSYQLPDLTSLDGLETIEVFKALAAANRSLAELKGRAAAIPNQGILIDTLALQEAKASSEIENIVTTQDELFQADLFPEGLESPAAKEVALYRDALKFGFDKLRQTEGLITNATIVGMFQLLKRRTDGFRQTPGTALRNDRSGSASF